jgi:O-antigen ligase
VSELRSFTVLIVVLAVIAGAGTIYEEKTGNNLFYETATAVFSPIANVEQAPSESSAGPGPPGRPMVAGPTRHALSIASILGMSLPFAIVLAMMAPDTRRRLGWGLAACVILAASLITQRRSGAVVPAVAILALLALRPRRLMRLAPLGIAALVIGLALSGGSFSSVTQLFNGGDQASTDGRTADYAAVVPDLLTHPMLGRGYGTLNSIQVDTYRIFDNEYLGQLYQVGVFGLIAFLILILTPVFIAWPAARSDSLLRGPPALAAAAGCVAFAVATSLYDILSFPQAPYLFLFLAAMCTCAASVERERHSVRRQGFRPAVRPSMQTRARLSSQTLLRQGPAPSK